jgi:hypothetical protein
MARDKQANKRRNEIPRRRVYQVRAVGRLWGALEAAAVKCVSFDGSIAANVGGQLENFMTARADIDMRF